MSCPQIKEQMQDFWCHTLYNLSFTKWPYVHLNSTSNSVVPVGVFHTLIPLLKHLFFLKKLHTGI